MSVLNESTFVAIGFTLFAFSVAQRDQPLVACLMSAQKIESELAEAQALREEAAAELTKFASCEKQQMKPRTS